MSLTFTDKISFNGQVNSCDVCYDAGNDKYVFAFIPSDGSANHGDFCVRVATRTGNELTFGAIVVVQVDSSVRNFIAIEYNVDTGKIVVITYYGSVYVGTVSGDTVTFGAPSYPLVTGKLTSFDSKIAVVAAGSIVVGSIAGSIITWGSSASFGVNMYSEGVDACYDSVNDKIVITYVERSTVPDETRGLVCSVSGTIVTVGASSLASSDTQQSIQSNCYDVSSGKVIAVSLANTSPSALIAYVGTVSGMTISFESPVVVATSTYFYVYGLSSVYNPTSESSNFVFRNNENNNLELLDLSYNGGLMINGLYEVNSTAIYGSTACAYDSLFTSITIAGNNSSENSADAILSIYTPEKFWGNNQGQTEV